MSTQPIPRLSPQQYLARERAAAFKSEYFQGETFAMAGASREHNLIVANLVREIGNALKDSDCEVYPSDLRLKITASGLYTYPDVTIAYGEPKFEDDQLDTLLNPVVLIEVLSESTEAYDRGVKSAHYRKLPSLRHYVMVSQHQCSVEMLSRSGDGTWTLNDATALSDTLRLRSPDVAVSLAEVYRNISFDDGNLRPA
jgi:Uma2 family endonuclease